MSYTSEFCGPIDGRNVIAGTHTAAGGTTNFHFGCSSAQNYSSQTREPFSTVPFAPDPDFVDRPAIVAWVRDKCAGPGARAALVGLGGVGKSQLALKYAHSIRDAAPQTFVFWVHASTQARFEEAYQDIADRLQLLGRDDPKTNVLRLVRNWLQDEANGQWMMIVDNVDNIDTFFSSRKRQRDEVSGDPLTPLAAYLPQSRNGAILVTSRSKDAASRLAGGYNMIKEVLAMDESEGLQLLRNKLQDPPIEQSARELLRTLDCIPLAITQAAAYINRRARMTVTSYLAEFWKSSKRRESLLSWDADELRRDKSASNSVVITWQISFEQIRQERRSAAELLSLMSFFNPQGIPESTLRKYSKDVAEAAAAEDKEDADSVFDKDLDTLRAYCLVSTATDNDTCEMHALVQFCTRVWLSVFSKVEQWEQRFVKLMAQELPSGNYENWGKCQQLLPHVIPLFSTQPADEKALRAWVHVLTNVAEYLWKRGYYSIAQQIVLKAVTAGETALGLDDQQTLSSVQVLAEVLHAEGKDKEAEILNRRVLEGREKELEEGHPNTLAIIHNLAQVLRAQGKYKEAETLSRRALEGYKKELGEDHSNTLASIGSLAQVLQFQGKYREAEIFSWRALEGWRKKLGEHHPNTLTSVNNLAVVLCYQGKYEEAEMLNRWEIGEKEKEELGKGHPSTLTSVSNLAVVLHDQGKYEEAEMLNRRALEGREKELGESHPNTLTSVSNLALVLNDQGKYREAEILSRRALEGREKELGERHPDTLGSVNNLALVLYTQGRYQEAEILSRRALEGYEKELGEGHPDTLKIVNNLAKLLQAQYKYRDAELLSRRVLEGRERCSTGEC